MPLYQIPLLQKFTKVGAITPGTFGKKAKCLNVDEVGLFVYYDKEEQLNPDLIRRHITVRTETRCFIEANNVEEAINIFYNEWEGARVGGDDPPESKALWIDKSREIMELPHCERMRKNKQDQFICGELLKSGNGEFGMCVLEDYDAPEDCPIDDFKGQIFDREKTNDLPIEMVRGFKIVRASQL